MAEATILASLALRFAAHPENIATEGLAHVLKRSPAASAAFCHVVHELAPWVTAGNLHIRTQAAGPDSAIPDLIGVDESGEQVVLVESKFWAGLTAAQPVTYLARLPDRGGLLLFLAPAARIPTLWPELCERCRAAELGMHEQRAADDIRVAEAGQARVLALVSWRFLLDRLLTAARDVRDEAAVTDLLQLRGLSDAMDTQAFLPLTSEELTSVLPRRILQYTALVDDLAARLVREGTASKEGLRASAGSGWYGQYLWLHGYGALLAFTARRWAELGHSPIWLRLTGRDWKAEPGLFDDVRLAAPEVPVSDSEDGVLVPIRLRMGVERDAVLEDAIQQLDSVARALAVRPSRRLRSASASPPGEGEGSVPPGAAGAV